MMRTLPVFCLLAISIVAAGEVPQMPMPNDYSNSILPRWLAKEVLETRQLDGMESLEPWATLNTGQANGTVTLTNERRIEGTSSLRLRSRTAGDKPLPDGRYFGSASAARKFPGENWNDWNRLSLWVYPDLPGFRVVSLLIIFHNEGEEKVPDVYGKKGLNYLILRNQQWNHIVWEIANLPRDKVTSVEFQYRLQGNEPGASDIVTFDFDKFELQKVVADHWEGWDVAPGQIAYSHSGYQVGAPKSALASDLKAAEFHLIDSQTGQPVLSKAIQTTKTQIGRFQVMDFSEVREPGSYYVRAGTAQTYPFRIGEDAWISSIWKSINFFYVERCGFAIPGVHDVCHRDWMLTHGDKKIPINGGWHDAGDLSQGLTNTTEAAYAMFGLAELLSERGEHPQLRNRILEEATWGLDWVIKASFGDGFRAGFSTMDRWTNDIVGDFDDMNARATNNPGTNFMASATEAIAARVLRATDAPRASYSLKKAEEDWNFAVTGMTAGPRRPGTDTVGHGVMASLELWSVTGSKKYADKAVELGQILMDSQQREFLPGLSYPLAGVFYTNTERTQVLRASHASHEAAPVLALVKLCEALPSHSDWMKWYSSVVLYSDYYQKAMAAFTQPYGMLANSVYFEDEQATSGGRGMTPDVFRNQVRNGVKVGDKAYVGLFPVWGEFRGNHGTTLTQTKGLSAAAHLRGNLELESMVQQQMQWVMGRNPFVQSTMWGEGHDYAPQYTAMSGDIVGSLPVGIQTRGDRDIPYWPTENCHNWKEVWVLPVSRWLWIMQDLAGPAMVSGLVDSGLHDPVEFKEAKTGKVTPVRPDAGGSRFQASLPAGEYEVTCNAARNTVTLLAGGTYALDFRSGHRIEFRIAHQTAADGTVTFTLTVEGSGRHKISARADNLTPPPSGRELDLKPGVPAAISWKAKMASVSAPWVAVFYSDDDLTHRKEATGTVPRTR